MKELVMRNENVFLYNSKMLELKKTENTRNVHIKLY